MIKSLKQTFLSQDLESPKWSPVETVVPGCDLRMYEASTWVSTVIKGGSQKEAMRQGFQKLFRYIQGKNEKEAKIEMTAPVTCLVQPGNAEYKISFFLPFKHQNLPLEPIDPDVFLEQRKGAAIFVRSFGGFASMEKFSKEAQALAETLQREGQSFHPDFYYTASYNSPFTLFNRHNEVWYFKKEEGEGLWMAKDSLLKKIGQLL
ncbi:heme-binding protein 2-like isoform X2 [Tachyglossus aculeatus]|uniref:heme-binding protein 2-like isoform X2 n=1 Tax=Tachyglossus aculeatus TaxID=9261 RepID=UPI0018F50726|nr:heme-binding protein 2-like isoform X2 [Tachyglossus aculeatus]